MCRRQQHVARRDNLGVLRCQHGPQREPAEDRGQPQRAADLLAVDLDTTGRAVDRAWTWTQFYRALALNQAY